jgi:sporulation protein YlmC with PRC-barrel domain
VDEAGKAYVLSEIRGRQVVSIAEGERPGQVKDLLIEPTEKKVIALVIGTSGGDSTLPLHAVRAIGPDAITIPDRTSLTPGLGESGKTFSELSKLPVLDAAGTDQGHLDDVTFELPSGVLISLKTKSGGVFGIGANRENLPAALVRSLGPSAVTVENLVP